MIRQHNNNNKQNKKHNNAKVKLHTSMDDIIMCYNFLSGQSRAPLSSFQSEGLALFLHHASSNVVSFSGNLFIDYMIIPPSQCSLAASQVITISATP